MPQTEANQYAPRAALYLSVPKFGSNTDFVDLFPAVKSLKWTRNNHLMADVVTATIDWRDGGCDPRMLKHGRVGLWVWDANLYGETLDQLPGGTKTGYRFTGVCVEVERRASETGMEVDITAHDYTAFFINMKPLPNDGMPLYTDTLDTAWKKICDNTGWKDPATGKIVSNVAALRDNLIIRDAAFEAATVGDMVPPRFRQIARPTPPHGATSWQVWQWIVCSLGLISYIERDNCIVTTSTEHFSEDHAPFLMWGYNIHDFKEHADNDVNNKGVLIKSFDTITGRVIEGVFPLPGDDRLKESKTVARRALKEEDGIPTVNDLSADYEEFEMFEIIDPVKLQFMAEQAYEQRNRQEMKGSIKTVEMRLQDSDGHEYDILDLQAADPIQIAIGLNAEDKDVLDNLASSQEAQIQYLVDHLGYAPELALLILNNIKSAQLQDPIFHMEQLQLHYEDGKFEIDIAYHNRIITGPPVQPNVITIPTVEIATFAPTTKKQ